MYPCNVAVDGRGNVLVHDGYMNGRIVVFRVSDGAYVRSMCSKGSGPGQLDGGGSIALDGEGYVAVADGGNIRVQVLRYSDGAHLRTIGSKGSGAGQFYCPRGVAFDGAGNIIVADSLNHLTSGAGFAIQRRPPRSNPWWQRRQWKWAVQLSLRRCS